MKDESSYHDVKSYVPRLACKVIADGKTIFERTGMDNLIFLTAYPGSIDGAEGLAQMSVVAGDPQTVHELAVSLMRTLMQRGEFMRAVMCAATGAHEREGTHSLQITDPKVQFDQDEMMEMIERLNRRGKGPKVD